MGEARRHFDLMVRWAKGHGLPLRFPAERVDFRWVPAVGAPGDSTASSDHCLGLTTVQWTEDPRVGLASRKYQATVWTKDTLPEIPFRGVTAHELGHLWMMTEGITDLQPEECEGVCELLAFLYYKSLGSEEGDRYARRIETNPDPIYGEGFRQVFRIFETAGMTAICKSLATTRRLPPGKRGR